MDRRLLTRLNAATRRVSVISAAETLARIRHEVRPTTTSVAQEKTLSISLAARTGGHFQASFVSLLCASNHGLRSRLSLSKNATTTSLVCANKVKLCDVILCEHFQ